MTRVIKFRAWDKLEKKFIIIEKIIGRYPKEYFYDNYVIGFDGKPYLVNGYGWFNEAKNIILMQFTGLQDKNGKDIYDGDIVENYAFRDTVIFDKGIFTTQRSTVDVFGVRQALSVHEELKVIGNKFENPELLEREQQ